MTDQGLSAGIEHQFSIDQLPGLIEGQLGYSAAHNAAQARYPTPDLEEQLNDRYVNRFGY
jgi:hypothetical protein